VNDTLVTNVTLAEQADTIPTERTT